MNYALAVTLAERLSDRFGKPHFVTDWAGDYCVLDYVFKGAKSYVVYPSLARRNPTEALYQLRVGIWSGAG